MTLKVRALAVLAAVGLLVSAAAVPAQAAPASKTIAKPRAGGVCLTVSTKAKVSGVNLKCIKNTRGVLRWTPVTAAGKIIVKRATVAAAPVTTTTVTTTTAPGAVADTPVRGPSGYEIVADPNNGGNPEVVYPDPADAEQPNAALAPAVATVTASNLTETSVDINFTTVAGVTGAYQVYLRYGDSFTLKGADGANPVVHFGELTPGWDYVACVYYLQPRESAKTCVNIHTLGTTPHTTNYLPGPTNVVATAVDNTIEVTWAELPNAQRYSVNIEHNSSFQAGGYTEVGGQRNHIRFNNGSVSPGLLYKVRVSALLDSGDWTVETMTTVVSNGSQPAPALKLPAPTNLRVTDVTPTSVSIAWDVPAESTNVTAWQVVARHETSFTATGAYPADRTFTIPNLAPGWGYQIIVSGYNSNTGVWTNEATVSVLLPTS
ncbi:MAG: Fibronectin type domain [Actinomycetota bacterium]|jgi:hypothetical protein